MGSGVVRPSRPNCSDEVPVRRPFGVLGDWKKNIHRVTHRPPAQRMLGRRAQTSDRPCHFHVAGETRARDCPRPVPRGIAARGSARSGATARHSWSTSTATASPRYPTPTRVTKAADFVANASGPVGRCTIPVRAMIGSAVAACSPKRAQRGNRASREGRNRGPLGQRVVVARRPLVDRIASFADDEGAQAESPNHRTV